MAGHPSTRAPPVMVRLAMTAFRAMVGRGAMPEGAAVSRASKGGMDWVREEVVMAGLTLTLTQGCYPVQEEADLLVQEIKEDIGLLNLTTAARLMEQLHFFL